jgi:hypothetical protein
MSYLNSALALLKKTNEVGTLFHIAAAPRHGYAPDAKHVLPGIKNDRVHLRVNNTEARGEKLMQRHPRASGRELLG